MSSSLDPRQITLSQLLNEEIDFETQYHISDSLGSKMKIDAFAYFRKNSKSLLCLLPSAQPKALDQQTPVFHRWSWFSHFPECSVISLSDPALYLADNLHAGWFMDEDIDIISNLAMFISQLSAKISQSKEEIILYGSSMGGFASLMIASELPGSLAIAEVPQVDMRTYPIAGAVKDLEDKVLNQTISDFYQKHPERVCVQDRFKATSNIPRLKIVTNRADPAFKEHIQFMENLSNIQESMLEVSDQQLHIVAENVGHSPLPTGRGIEIIRNSFEFSSRTVRPSPEKKLEIEATYDQLISIAVGKIEAIKFIRNKEDTENYEAAKDALYRAASLRPSADWPYRRLCSLIKLWTNSFNMDILDAANKAFERKESLEAFIYVCRGLLYNYPPADAGKKIDELVKSTEDDQVRNIGNIFQALVSYEKGDFGSYSRYIEKFKVLKHSDFEPYIAIPVSTITTEQPDSLDPSPDLVNLLGREIKVNIEIPDHAKYIVSASCDEVYFKKYARYLIESFSTKCSSEAVMHLSVITEDPDSLVALMEDWGAKSVYISAMPFPSDGSVENIGPISSLLRFSYVYPLLKLSNIPVVVLDLDSVIINPLASLISKHENSDICSRILGNGVAPWEKYTGGFAVFYPSEVGVTVAGYVAAAANRLCRGDVKQWWIDQNCFEAGIRLVQQSGHNIQIDNVSSERNNYCVMPVGSGESKIHNLELAIKQVREIGSPKDI